MGDGVSDLVARGEASDKDCDEAVRKMINDRDGSVVWWPGGRHHSAVLRMRDRGEIKLENISEPQETKYRLSFSALA